MILQGGAEMLSKYRCDLRCHHLLPSIRIDSRHVWFSTKSMKRRAVELPYSIVCLDRQSGSWKREIRSRSAFSVRLNENKRRCPPILPHAVCLCAALDHYVRFLRKDFVVTCTCICASLSWSCFLLHVQTLSLSRHSSFSFAES